MPEVKGEVQSLYHYLYQNSIFMNTDQWYIVLESTEVKKKPVGVTRLNEKLVFWRDQSNKVHCLSDPCIHRGAALSFGECVDNHIRCPFHGLEFDSTGRCVIIPANGAAKPVPENFVAHGYQTYENHGFIWIFFGNTDPGETKPEFFGGLGNHSKLTRVDPWATHFSRAIENQLDVAHLPFVHRKTIGRGGRTVADGPRLTWLHKNRFRVDVYNRLENGQRQNSLMKPLQNLRIHNISILFSPTFGKIICLPGFGLWLLLCRWIWSIPYYISGYIRI